MGFLDRERSNIDPFNAGDPVMPWDEPQATEDIEPAANGTPVEDEGGYRAPTKQQDDYEPQAREENAAATEVAAGNPRKKAPSRETAPHAAAPAKRSSNPKRLIIGIVVGMTALSLLVGFIGAAIDTVEDLVSDATSSANPFDDSTDSYDAGPSVVIDEESEQEIHDLVQAKLDSALADTAGMNVRCIKVLNQCIESSLGYSAEELGLDTDAFSTWMQERISVEISGVYCYEDDTASIYIDSSHPAIYRLTDSFTGRVGDYLNGQSADELTDNQKERINKLFARTLDDLDDTGSTVRLEAEKEDGTWQVDDDDFNTAVNQLLGDYEE